jgi:hypothetical protein
MSTINVNKVVDTSGGVLAPISSVFRNRIINGAMVIDQRNAGASVTPTAGQYTLDRYAFQVSQASKLTCQQNAGSVTPPVGFSNYLGITSSSAYSVTSTDYFFLYHVIEGFNSADLQWGTANAKTVTLSFQVYSSLTGTFSGSFRNNAGNRSYPFTYTVSLANTWTTISITVAGDTTGTWVGATNGKGIFLTFGLGSGSTRLGTANSWQAGDFDGATGSVSVVGTNGATFYITGVQLEVGTQATSFDYRPYTTELALCQRYYAKTYNQSAVPGTVSKPGALFTYRVGGDAGWNFQMPQVMRTAPTFVLYSPGSGASGKCMVSNTDFNVFTNSDYNGDKNILIYSTGLSGGADVYVHAACSAEL